MAIVYAEVVELNLGSSDDVVRCLAAWEKEIQLGLLALSRAEINDSAAWRSAHVKAVSTAVSSTPWTGEFDLVISLR